MGNRRAVVDLFSASALSLFVELIFIRWVSSELKVFSFYRNLALIAAFLGLGLGFAIHRREKGVPWFTRFYLPLMALVVLCILAIGRNPNVNWVTAVSTNSTEFVWPGVTTPNPALVPLVNVLFYASMLALFVLITVVFIPLGELVASKFASFEPLPGYTINVLGSLAGILLYTAISFLSWPPPVWFLIAGLGALYFLPRESIRPLALRTALIAFPILITWLWPTGAETTLWSPYYRIDLNSTYADNDRGLRLGYDLSVNQAYHQYILNLSPDFVAANRAKAPEHFADDLTEYDSPYKSAVRLNRVLVVGAGTGNDVAAGLRAGARQITAVEIDPVIFQLGLQLHPEHPYADPTRVIQINADARSFFRRDKNIYDVIIFGLLDSHTLLGTASSVRLDNFVYTEESLTEARNLLAPDGVMALSFGVPYQRPWIGLRLYRDLTDVFGHSPQVYTVGTGVTMFLIARNPLPENIMQGSGAVPASGYSYRDDIPPATDDWPYLYLQSRLIPDTYLIILAGVILFSLLFIRRALPDFTQFNTHLFFMGAAFFMLETKSTTEMALLFGSTWVVNAVVIGAILLMIVLANLVVIRFKLTDVHPYYGLLGLTLLFNFFVPVGSFLGLDLVWRISLASLAVAAPLFFAGMIFAIAFKQTKSVESALGSNLIGSVLGGILEYISLITGIRSLYLLALGLYALSAVALYMARRRSSMLSAT